MKKHWVWPLLMMSLVWGSAFGAIEAQDFPSEAVKTRYYDLIAMLRCPQCLNTNLAGSDAMIAQNLRSTVLRLLVEGRSDDEVKQFMYERYGDFILYEPRWTPKTWLLWLGPLVLAVMGLGIWWSMGFSRRDTRQGLTDLDRKKVQQLLER